VRQPLGKGVLKGTDSCLSRGGSQYNLRKLLSLSSRLSYCLRHLSPRQFEHRANYWGYSLL